MEKIASHKNQIQWALRFVTGFLVAALCLFFVTLDSAFAEKEPYRVAYIQGDPYVNYAGNLSGLITGLSNLGMVDEIKDWGFIEGSDDARLIWAWLKKHSSEDIEFDQEEFYSLITMTDEEKTELLRHLTEDQPVDLILVMGTAAAKFVQQAETQCDIMVMSVTNAYQAGIVEDIDYSGIENIWAHMSPNRYYNQLNVFQTIFPFQALGIVYEDSETGRNEISYIDIRKFAADKGIALVEVAVNADQKEDGADRYEEKMMQAYQQLASQVDAVYMTNSGFRTTNRIPEYLEPFRGKGVPVFSQTGKNDVKYGATMTIYRYSFQEIGDFCADRFLRIKDGESPGSLDQRFDESQTICFNLAAAEEAGIQLPFKVLLSSDTIYTKIGGDQ
jgi:ABC-type uncharacterized transport system substrate-binding protein